MPKYFSEAKISNKICEFFSFRRHYASVRSRIHTHFVYYFRGKFTGNCNFECNENYKISTTNENNDVSACQRFDFVFVSGRTRNTVSTAIVCLRILILIFLRRFVVVFFGCHKIRKFIFAHRERKKEIVKRARNKRVLGAHTELLIAIVIMCTSHCHHWNAFPTKECKTLLIDFDRDSCRRHHWLKIEFISISFHRKFRWKIEKLSNEKNKSMRNEWEKMSRMKISSRR